MMNNGGCASAGLIKADAQSRVALLGCQTPIWHKQCSEAELLIFKELRSFCQSGVWQPKRGQNIILFFGFIQFFCFFDQIQHIDAIAFGIGTHI